MNIQVNKTFVRKLLKSLAEIGIKKTDIICILLGGSSLYLNNSKDIDLKVIVKYRDPHVQESRSFDINGTEVDCIYYTLNEWNSIKYRETIYFVTESPDLVTIYGDDKNFIRHDILKDKELARRILENYNRSLFHYQDENILYGYNPMPPKRIWNFLMFAYKLKNNSHRLTKSQLKEIQKVHDSEVNVGQYEPLFNEISEILKGE